MISMTNKITWACGCVLLGISLFVLPVYALDFTTTVDGDWNTLTWTEAGFPNTNTGTDTANIEHAVNVGAGSGAGGDFAIRNGNTLNIHGGSVTHSLTSGNWFRIGEVTDGTVNITAGTLDQDLSNQLRAGLDGGHATIIVGDGAGAAGSAVFDTDGGELYLGTDDGGTTGTATLTINSDGVLEANAGNKWIGHTGTGSLIMNGGQFNVSAGNVVAGEIAGSSGTLSMASGSTFTQTGADGIFFGSSGSGTLAMTGGTLTDAGGNFYFGNASGSTGIGDLSGTAVVNKTAGETRIGQLAGSAATVTMSGSAAWNQAAGNFTLAQDAGSTGVLIMNGDSTYTQNSGDFYVGRNGAATVIMNNNASITHTPSNWFWVGRDNGTSTMTLNDNASVTTSATNFQIGANHGSEAAGTTDGTLTINDASTVNANNNMVLGRNENGRGTLNVNDSSELTIGSELFVGQSGIGTVNQTGGTLNVNGANLYVGQNATAQGTYNISSGTLNSANTITLGSNGGTGVMQQTGGSVITTTLNINDSGDEYSLENGFLNVDAINEGAGQFNFEGGMLSLKITDSNEGTVDHSLNAAGNTIVRDGKQLDIAGDIATLDGGATSTINLGGLYLNDEVRQNVVLMDGNLDLAATDDTLIMGSTPALLRPASHAVDFGALPLLSFTSGALTGTFENFIAPTDDGLGWTEAASAPAGNDPSLLAVNTWHLQQDGTGVFLLYNVQGIPEPGSLSLLVLGLVLLQTLRGRIAPR